MRADLEGADLAKANLMGANLTKALLRGANLAGANLTGARLAGVKLLAANLTKASLRGADLSQANLWAANLRGATLEKARLRWTNLTAVRLDAANLTKANVSGAILTKACLGGANLSGADLEETVLVETHLENAILTGCRVHGISAWDVHLKGAEQTGLVITPAGTAEITVDDLEVAQFIYLLLHNVKIRRVIDTVTSKVVLILGRFTPGRKAVLDALRERLRAKNYSPVVFDFEKPASRNLTETIRVLAGMARFVIADITDAKSIPQELMAIVPDLPSVPVQPILLASEHRYGMFDDFRQYRSLLDEKLYESPAQLVRKIESLVIAPAEHWLEKHRPARDLSRPRS
jgi:hypothetical protein